MGKVIESRLLFLIHKMVSPEMILPKHPNVLQSKVAHGCLYPGILIVVTGRDVLFSKKWAHNTCSSACCFFQLIIYLVDTSIKKEPQTIPLS